MLIPTIHFQGNCNEAITFYKETLGAEVKEIAYAKDAPAGTGMDNLPSDFVMYSEIQLFNTIISMTDGAEAAGGIENFSYMIMFDTADEVTNVFNKLAKGGTIVEPLAPQFFSSMYGFVKDKFGVGWSIGTKDIAG